MQAIDISVPTTLPKGMPHRIAGPYACDRMGCRKPHQPTETMWQHGRSFLCAECHDAMVSPVGGAEPACVICGEPASDGKETCGNAAGKCAKMLKRRSEREAKAAQSD